MLYHEKPDPFYVRDFLGHKEIRNTEIYVKMAHAIFDSSNQGEGFIVRIAQTPEQVKQMLELGFDYVCTKDNLIFLRKRR